MKQYLSNMFSIINNGLILKQRVVVHQRTKFGEKILRALWKEGFIWGYKIYDKDSTKLVVFLKYIRNKSAINSLKIISTPSRKIYFRVKQLWKLDSIHQIVLVSTNKGVKSLVECKRLNLGGQVILLVS